MAGVHGGPGWVNLAARKRLRRNGHVHIPRRSLADGSFCGGLMKKRADQPCFSITFALASAPSIDSLRTDRGTPQRPRSDLCAKFRGFPEQVQRRLTANLGADRDAAPRAAGRYRRGRKPPVRSLTSLIWKEKRRRRRPGDSETTLSRR